MSAPRVAGSLSARAWLTLATFDSLEDRAYGDRGGRCLVEAAERPELVDDACQGSEHRATPIAAREVPSHSHQGASFELAVDEVGEVLGRLVTGRDPRSHEDAQHE